MNTLKLKVPDSLGTECFINERCWMKLGLNLECTNRFGESVYGLGMWRWKSVGI